jgi:hypothetical protein
VEFRILGPLEVVEQGRTLALGGPRQRALLALLLTRANEVVSADRLSAPPPGADAADKLSASPPGVALPELATNRTPDRTPNSAIPTELREPQST